MKREQGLLYRIESLNLVADERVADGWYFQPLAFMISYMMSPVLKKLRISIVEVLRPGAEIVKTPARWSFGEGIRVMHTSDLFTVIDGTRLLKTFCYNHVFAKSYDAEGYDNEQFDHVKVINRLGQKHGATLEIVMFNCDSKNGKYYTEANQNLNQVRLENW